ncbi:uncharacterized protein LOC132262618 [Phlebotomus argentipes]|uniref:uncharacterized protein LOC132262618 n=1 Tax=Phlebotomus argentipes TaxID=94469 RepID=UPI002892E93B|nr:uncharacterized protein LOC132262618 [Phlebotomus argentipes]
MVNTIFDSEKKIWSCPDNPSPLFHEKVTLGRAVLYLLNMNPEKVCQISADDGSKRTNGEIYLSTLKIAFNLQKLGCAKGDVVGFICRNSHDLTPAFLAALFLGAPPNALDVAFTKEEIVHMFKTTLPKFVFCDYDNVMKVQLSLSHIDSDAKIIVIGRRAPNFAHIEDLLDDGGNLMDILKLAVIAPEVDRKSCGAIICSSGTTGLSKGVAISHEVLQLMFTRISMRQFVESTDCAFNFSSLYWLSGYIILFMGLFMGIPRIITTKPFSPELFLSIVKKYKVSICFSSPSNVSELLNCPQLNRDSLASIKGYLCSGSLITNELYSKIRNYLTNGLLLMGYGMTECGTVSFNNLPSDKVHAGQLSFGVRVKILDKPAKQLGIGEDGEICLKSPTQFLGYYRSPEATAEILDDDGWIHTGDIGHFDEDGNLNISGRCKDMFKYSNYHISPGEIEEILESHPEVLQAVVVGIPDPVHIDLPAAIVVRKSSSVSEDELIKLVQGRVMDFKRLRGGVFFVNELPMTVSGKIKRAEATKLAIELYSKKIVSKL